MALPIKYKYPELVEAGLYRLSKKQWMGGKTIWMWHKGSDGAVAGAFTSQVEAEEAAKAWVDAGAAKLIQGL